MTSSGGGRRWEDEHPLRAVASGVLWRKEKKKSKKEKEKKTKMENKNKDVKMTCGPVCVRAGRAYASDVFTRGLFVCLGSPAGSTFTIFCPRGHVQTAGGRMGSPTGDALTGTRCRRWHPHDDRLRFH
jgi:hypothetical protein